MVLSQGPSTPSRPNHQFDGLVRSAGFCYLRTQYMSGGYWQEASLGAGVGPKLVVVGAAML